MYSLRSGRKEKGDLMTDVCRGIFGWGGGGFETDEEYTSVRRC